MIYLDLEDLLHIAARVIEAEVGVRDAGLLDAAASRPRATVFGEDAYPDLHHKCAALLQSIVKNQALVDGNKRLGLAATIAFLGINGWILCCSEDEAYDFVIEVAAGDLSDVPHIAERLLGLSAPFSTLSQ